LYFDTLLIPSGGHLYMNLNYVLKIHATAAGRGFDLGTGVARVSAVMSDGHSGEIYASCTAKMVDLKRRMRWKHKAKSKI
jgi:hypothetical protein